MSTFCIETGLVLLGMTLLMVQAFAPRISRSALAWTGIAGVVIALVLLVFAPAGADALPEFVRPFYLVDGMAKFYKAFALVITALMLWLVVESEQALAAYSAEGKLGELIGLPLIVCAGMMWMASAADLVTVFVSLELVTVSFYVLVAYTRKSALSLEAGVKYLILGASSTGALVYGAAWVYGATGSLTFEGIAAGLAAPEGGRAAALFGIAFLLAGLGFKVAAAPFHVWVPDVYQGAPTPVTAYLSVGSKAAGFIVLTRTANSLMAQGSIVARDVEVLLLTSAGITLILGSLPAIFQTSVKRLLGYSSISHAGFLLLALACRDSAQFGLAPGGVVAFYLATYLPMTVLAFLVLCVLRNKGVGDSLDDLQGLARRSPLLALLLTIAMASLAGLPLTAGFLGKMLVFFAAVDQGHYALVILAIISAAAGFYYYFRVILAMYSGDGATTPDTALRLSPLTRAGGLALAAAVLILGVYPKPLQRVLAPSGGTSSPAVARQN